MRGMREEEGGERERKRKDRGERKQKGRKEGRKKVYTSFVLKI